MTSVPVKAPIEELPTIHAVTNDEIMLRPGFLRKAMGIMRVLGDKGAIHIRSQLLRARSGVVGAVRIFLGRFDERESRAAELEHAAGLP